MGSAQQEFSYYERGRLRCRAARPAIAPDLAAGCHQLVFPDGRQARLQVPSGYEKFAAMPLLTVFHGANRQDGGALVMAMQWAERHGALLIAQNSAGLSWDIVRGQCGPDLAFFDFLLEWTMQRYVVDPARIAIAGFSDGASYALSVGLMNGDLFRDVMAFSPGFVRTLSRTGQPRIFVAHGKDDTILSVDRGRTIAARLADDGYDVQFHEFSGGHTVLRYIADQAMNRFISY